MSTKFNTTNTYKPLNVCQKIGNIQELRNVFVAPPDQLQPVMEHIAKQNGRQAILMTLAGSQSGRDNFGGRALSAMTAPSGKAGPFSVQLEGNQQ
jgi:hypothetical protein